MFDYKVMTNEEAEKERYSLLNDGEYHATIKKCESRMSASNNHMLALELDVYDDQGKSTQIRDFLVFTPKMMWKIIHACNSAGVSEEYEKQLLTPELLVDLNVRVKIVTQEGNAIPPDKLNGKPMGSCYPTKNVVDDYVKRDGAVPVSPRKGAADFNDDVPF